MARTASFSMKAGSVEVPVYFRRRTVDGKRYPEFTVVFYGADGKRLRRSFGDPGKARMEAQRVAASLSRGHSEATHFTAAEATLYGRAVSLLEPLDIPLVAAIEEYVAARALLPVGTSLKDAARDLARNLHLTDSRPVRDIVAELLADRESAARSEVHLRDLRTRLGRFADVFQCPLGSVSAGMVRDFIHDLKTAAGKPVTNRTRKNCLRIVASLYHFAGKRRYIPTTLVEDVRGIEAPKAVSGEAAIWTPKEMRALLAAAKPYLIPALAIGGFTGCELQRLPASTGGTFESVRASSSWRQPRLKLPPDGWFPFSPTSPSG